jgi:antitoxin ParD1/3/4
VSAIVETNIIEGSLIMSHGLPADLEQFVEQELASGKYASRDELVTEAVRLLRERERRLEELRQEVLPALERLDRGEYTEYDDGSLRGSDGGRKSSRPSALG